MTATPTQSVIARPGPHAPLSRSGRRPAGLYLVYSLWFLTLCDPQWWFASFGPDIVLRLPLVLTGIMLVLMIPRLRPGVLIPLLLLYLGVLVVNLPFTYNRGFAMGAIRLVTMWYLLGVGTLVFVRRIPDLLPILLLFMYQYAWWAVHGAVRGLVPWHPTLANFDGYGPLMVIGLGYCYYFSTGARSSKVRWIGFILTGLCLLGVVASFARGAFLSLVLAVAILWIRSPRKLRTTGWGIVACLVVGVGSSVLFPDGGFWQEMSSSFTEGTEEGTGQQRKDLWTTAVRVFSHRPVFGVGPQQFGAYAANVLTSSEIPEEWADNPGRLYGMALHSVYFQVLSESGLAGVFLFFALIADFWRRNLALRKRALGSAWARATGSEFNLRSVSLGLELAMVGYLASSFFYDQLYVHWFYTLIILNMVLHMVTERECRVARATAVPAWPTGRRQ